MGCVSFLLRRQDSNMRPPGYEPGELPTAPLRDHFVVLFLKSAAKVRLFSEIAKYLFCFFEFEVFYECFLPNHLVVWKELSNFAHCICNVQY